MVDVGARIPRRDRRRGGLFGVVLSLAALGPAGAATGAPSAKPTVPPGYAIVRLADVPTGVTNCDDLARLDGHLFMGCQNATTSVGGGGNSTLLEYADDGSLLNKWSIPDKVDGVGADALTHRVIITLNEDAHSHLATIMPSAPTGQQVVNYHYSPGAPSSTATAGALHTGGGTDSVSVDSTGGIYITGSHAQGRTGTAVFKVVLTPPASPGVAGSAALSSTWLDNARTVNGAPGGGTVALSLGDVDSGAIVPYSSPRYGGSHVIDDQTTQQLVFASDINAPGGGTLTALKTTFGLDDIRWATSDGGTLYVVDKGAPAAAGRSSLWKVTGPFVAGTALASNDGLGNQVVKVNLSTGALTPFVRNLVTSKGLVYVDANGTEAPLATASAASLPTAAPVRLTKSNGGGSSSSGDGDTLPLVLAIGALVLGLLALGAALMRRGAQTVSP